jgi:hypothetical protein
MEDRAKPKVSQVVSGFRTKDKFTEAFPTLVAAITTRHHHHHHHHHHALSPSTNASSVSSSPAILRYERQQRRIARHEYHNESWYRRRQRMNRRANFWMSRHYLTESDTIARRIQYGIEKIVNIHIERTRPIGYGGWKGRRHRTSILDYRD